MVTSFASKNRIRRSFGRVPEVAPMPNLIEVQKSSYDHFLQMGVVPEQRANVGLQEVFKSVFPIRDFSDRAQLEFVRYELEVSKYEVDECQQRGITFAAPLKVTLRLVVWDVDEDTGSRSIRDIKEQDVYMGDMPLMTKNGTFLINGTERVIVSQMHRSPGVFFDHDKGKTHSSGKYLFAARVIPYRGSWLDFEFDAKDNLYVRIDRRRKLPATTLLLALDSAATEASRARRAAENSPLQPGEATGMSKEEILSFFYGTVVFRRVPQGWMTPFDPEQFKSKLTSDLRDARTGETVLAEGERITSRTARRLHEDGLTDIQVGDEVTPLEIPITTTMIVAGAIASRDFMPVHHDRAYANKQGSPNLFMNILTTNGYCVRFLTDWAGPEAMVKNLSIRLGVPCFPDDPLRFTGSVTGKTEGSEGENFVEVTFRGSNSLGDHVSGTAILSLLDGAGA